MKRLPIQSMSIMVGAFLGLILVLGVSLETRAQGGDDYVPGWTHYQGYLTDSGGNLLNGNVDLYFAVYDAETGGNKQWEQYRDGVAVDNGYFYARMGGASSPLTIDDFQAVSDRIPFIADLKPSGQYVMEDVHNIGGIPAVMKYLLEEGLIDGSCMSVTGKTIAENLAELPRLATPADFSSAPRS